MALPFLICLAMYCGYRMFPSANELYRMFLSANELQPPLVFKPILTFPKGRNKLLCFVKDFSKSILPMNLSPHLASPVGEDSYYCC